jgi:hypothetical protein
VPILRTGNCMNVEHGRPQSQTMTARQNRCLLWVLCGILVVCLAGIELPELLTLTNDTSNDYSTFLTAQKASVTVQTRVTQANQGNAGAAVPRIDYVHYVPDGLLTLVDTVTSPSSHDLLVLHSFWRT